MVMDSIVAAVVGAVTDASMPSRSQKVLVTSAIFLAIATVFIVMRSISKFGIRKRADIDDGVILLAWLFTVALAVTVIVGAANGLGKPDAILLQHPEWWGPLKKSVYIFPIFYHLSSMTAKTSALLLYIRMASAHTFLRYSSYVVLAIVDVSGIVLVLMNIFQCRPLSAAWTWSKEGQCFDLVTLFLASSPINVLSDLAILYMPLPIITGLRIERTAKIGLVLAFLCGIFVAIVDVVRIAYLQTALKAQVNDGKTHVSASDRPPNYYWYTSWGIMWSVIECSVRVACCCALVLKPFLQKLWPSSFIHAASSRQIFSSKRSRSRHSGSNGRHSRPLDGMESAQAAGPEVSVLSHKSGKNMPIHAILETSPEVPEEDCMDITEFFAGGPPDTNLNRASAFGDPRQSPRLGVGHLGLGLAKSNGDGHINGNGNPNDESPASTDTMGGPLTHAPTRLSERTAGWSMLTAPIRWMTHESVPMDQTQQPTQRFFDVVQMGGRKPLTELTKREAWWPVMFVNILFFLWGFSYGLLGNLNSQIMKTIPDATPARALALQNAYWLGYILGPSTLGAYTLTRHGFKATFMTGLVVYGIGTMCFWPSSVLASYGGFVFCNLVIAMGLSILEVAANPFIALAGPGELSEARLNFSQAIQAVASIFSPILADKVFFRTVDGRESLFDVQWCYLAVALFVLFLALVFHYVPLPEATDDELEVDTTARLHAAGLNLGSRAFAGRVSSRWYIIVTGCIGMMLYVGAQESISYFWGGFFTDIQPHTSLDSFWTITVAHGLFAASRFIAAGMCYLGFTPRLILNVCLTGTFLTTLLAVVLPNGNGPLVCIILALFFEGPVFPTLFATALRGQGRRTKYASVGLTIAIGMAVIWQSSTWAIVQHTGRIRTAWILVAVLCGIQMLWPLSLDASPVLRRFVDPKWSRRRDDEVRRKSIQADRIEHEKALQALAAKSKANGPTTVTVKPRNGSSQTNSSENVGAMPALPALQEEATGPTEDFAGIGVVGDLPEIKI